MMVVVVACVVDQLASDVGSCVVHWVGHYFSPSIVEASALHYVGGPFQLWLSCCVGGGWAKFWACGLQGGTLCTCWSKCG